MIMDILALWNDNMDIEWWRMLLIGLFFLVVNAVIFLAMWCWRLSTVREYGYPKRSRKTVKKRFSVYSTWEKLLLIRPTREAEKKGLGLYMNLMCHYICLLAFVVSLVGFVGCMVTLADGWAFTLLIIPELAAMGFTAAVMFIPDLIWSPSERRRYGLK